MMRAEVSSHLYTNPAKKQFSMIQKFVEYVEFFTWNEKNDEKKTGKTFKKKYWSTFNLSNQIENQVNSKPITSTSWLIDPSRAAKTRKSPS